MAEKGFGVKEVNLIGPSGTPTITSPNNLNLNAVNVAISTNVSIGGTLSVTGNVSIGGTLTYEDVTNIDSVGLVTAREGVFIPDNKELKIGNTAGSPDTKIFSNGNKTRLVSTIQYDMDADIIDIHNASANSMKARFLNNPVELYYANNKKFETTSSGATVTGTLVATTFSGSGASLTSLPAANLTGTLPAISGANLTNLPVTDPSNSDIQVVYTVTANGSSAYRFGGNGIVSTEDNPDVYLIRGLKYRFINNSGGSHPFQIRVSNGGSAYSSGVTNNGASSGNIDFQVPYSAPSHLYYQCTSHGGMVGNLYIRGAGGQNRNVGLTTFVAGIDVDGGPINIFNGGGAYNTHLNYNDSGQNYITMANGSNTVFRGSSNGVTSLIVHGSGQLDIYDRIRHLGDTDTFMEFSTDTVRFDTAGGERLRITSDGNIGVAGATGTDFSLLDGMVVNTANGSAGLLINSSSSSHNAYLGFSYGSGSSTSHADQYSAYIGRVGDNNLILGTNNNIRVTIDSNGNFNLGLTGSPAQSTTEQGVFLAGADSTQSVISSNVTPLAINRMGTGGNDRNCIEFRNNGSLKGTVGAVGVNNGIFFQTGVTEVMRITNDYKVLVGLTTTTTTTSNNNLELAGTKMLKVGNMYIGYVIGTGNNSNGVLILHKMGQNVGLQFSGMLTIHSYTGSAYLSGCIVVRYNTDAVTRDLTLQKAQSGANFELVSGTISGESGTYFGIKKNGGGTGSFYINAFVGGNIESYGGIREVSNSNWTTSTTHFTVT